MKALVVALLLASGLNLMADPPRAIMDDPATKHVSQPSGFWAAQPGDSAFVAAVRASQTNDGAGVGGIATNVYQSAAGTGIGIVTNGLLYTLSVGGNLLDWLNILPSSKLDAPLSLTAGDIPDLSGSYIARSSGTGTNTTIQLTTTNGLNLRLPSGGIYRFLNRSGFLRLTNTVNAGEVLDFNHGLSFGIGSPTLTLGKIDMSSGTAAIYTGDGSSLTNIPESSVVGLVDDLAGKQNTLTTGNLTASSPLSFNNTRQVIGGAAALTISDASADGTTKGAATFTASDFNASSGVISLDYANGQTASGSLKGYLSSSDWTTFNNKQPAGNYITALTGIITASGPGSAATTFGSFSSSTLATALTDESGSTGVVPLFSLTSLAAGHTIGWDGAKWTNGVAATEASSFLSSYITADQTLTAGTSATNWENVTGLQVTVEASSKYTVTGILTYTNTADPSPSAGGEMLDFGGGSSGSCTVNYMRILCPQYQNSGDPGGTVNYSFAQSLNQTVPTAPDGNGNVWNTWTFTGTIEVNAGGIFRVRIRNTLERADVIKVMRGGYITLKKL